MKKNILLILMFIALFFGGSNDVFAGVRCESNETGCLENLQEYMREINGKLACLYEVELDNNKKYYNYIYYGSPTNDKNDIYGGTTLGGADKLLQTDGNISIVGGNAWLLGNSAYTGLYNNNQCPSKSYIDPRSLFDWAIEICFDNDDGSCGNKSKFATSKSELKKDNSSVLLYDDLGFKNSCDTNKLPENYTKLCRYVDSSYSKTIFLLYDNNKNTLIYDDNGVRNILDNDVSTVIGEGVYTNKINASVNSCPSNIYINRFDESKEFNGDIYQKYNSFETSTNSTADSSIKLDYYDCSGNDDIVIDDGGECEDFIDPVLIDTINDIMNIVRIAVPILLIGLITYDFATAVFAGADDKINKAKSRAIKRVIIAIVIFFVPTLVNLAFNIVNDVWGTNFGTCNIGHDK